MSGNLLVSIVALNWLHIADEGRLRWRREYWVVVAWQPGHLSCNLSKGGSHSKAIPKDVIMVYVDNWQICFSLIFLIESFIDTHCHLDNKSQGISKIAIIVFC